MQTDVDADTHNSAHILKMHTHVAILKMPTYKQTRMLAYTQTHTEGATPSCTQIPYTHVRHTHTHK